MTVIFRLCAHVQVLTVNVCFPLIHDVLCDADLKRDEFPICVFRVEKPKMFILNSFKQFLKAPSETLNLRDPLPTSLSSLSSFSFDDRLN